jgi:hypothetical protein
LGEERGEMNKKLFYIKLVHTIIWLFYVVVIFYILYAGIWNKIDVYTLIAIGLVVLEGLILLAFRWRCPLTVLGLKYTENNDVGFDILIPKWLAKNNKIIFGTLYGVGVIIVIIRLAII